MQEENKKSVDDLHDKLYSRTADIDIDPNERTPLSEDTSRPRVGWQDTESPEQLAPRPNLYTMSTSSRKTMSVPVKFFLSSLAFFCVALLVAVFFFFTGGNSISPQNIDLTVVMPSVIDGGKTSSVQIVITNRNQADLELADLIITYPNSTRDPAHPGESLMHERQSIGTIAPGQTVQRTAQAVFYGQEGQQQKIAVQLQYNIEGSNAIFERDADVTFTVGSSPVSISVSSPSEAISDQQFAMDIAVQSNAPEAINDVAIQGQYPFGFTVANTSPTASAGGTLWRLGTLAPGERKVIRLVGSLNGQDGDSRVFYFLAGSNVEETDTRIKVPFLSVPQTLVVHRAFITGQIAVAGQTGKTITVPAGSEVQGTVTWANNLPMSVSDVSLKLSFSGPVVDMDSISAQTGFYQSSDGSILWSKDKEGSLGEVAPGQTGTLPFSFSTKAPGAGGTLYSNGSVTLNLTIEGTRQGQTNVPEHISSAASTQVRLSSVASLASQALHFSGPFSNTGPMPPIAGQTTTYTVLWTVSNSSNTIANAAVSATLPSYVNFITAAPGSGITYDTKSRTVTWSLGDVKAGTGFGSAARSGAFQVSLSPSTSQRGQSPALTGTATLTGQDRFTQAQVNATAGGPTTQLQNDGNYNSSMGSVQ